MTDATESLAGKVRRYVRYHLDDKWQFVYFEYDLARPYPNFPRPDGLTIRIGTRADRDQVERDVFPDLIGPQLYERRYFAAMGDDPNHRCYLAESDGRIVHYSWVATDARASVMASLPVGDLRETDAYIGPVFTVPAARGFVYPCVLGQAINDLRAMGRQRLLLMIFRRQPAMMSFYARLGFKETGRPSGGGPLSFLTRR